jgi:hypothetical protein
MINNANASEKIRREPLLSNSTLVGTWKNLDRLKETGKGTRRSACCSTLPLCCQNFQVLLDKRTIKQRLIFCAPYGQTLFARGAILF